MSNRKKLSETRVHIVPKGGDDALCGRYMITTQSTPTIDGATCDHCIGRWPLWKRGILGRCKFCGRNIPVGADFDKDKMMHITCSRKDNKIRADFTLLEENTST
jgi:hypothetical protein